MTAPDPGHLLAALARGDLAATEAGARRLFPDQAATGLWLLARVALARGDGAGAKQRLRAALVAAPALWPALADRLALDADATAPLAVRGVHLRPKDPRAWLAYLALVRNRGAGLAPLVAQALYHCPGAAELHILAGETALNSRDWESGLRAARRAAVIAPGAPTALGLGAELCRLTGRENAAEARRDRAARLAPDDPVARFTWTFAPLRQVHDDADQAARAARLVPARLADLAAWVDSDPRRAAPGVGTASPFLHAYLGVDDRAVLADYGRLCARAMAAAHPVPPPPARPPAGRPLTVGVVSRFLADHSVHRALVAGWVDDLAAAGWPVIAFVVGGAPPASDHYARVHGGLDRLDDAIARIRAEAPDVLLYPELAMDTLTLQLASLRLAPVQVASWGHAAPTGLPTIDAYLGAEALDPPGAEAGYPEPLIRLPGLGVCYHPPAAEPEPMAERIADWAPDGAITYICPHFPAKFHPAEDALLVAIARALPQAVFLIPQAGAPASNHHLACRQDRAFAAAGLDPAQHLRRIPPLSLGRFRGLLAAVDVFLDPWRYSGFNTAMEAIGTGLAPVTPDGARLRSRLAAGILSEMGITDTLARDRDHYVALAVALGRDPARRADLRARVAAARPRVYGDPRVGPALRAALDSCHRRALDRSPPSP